MALQANTQHSEQVMLFHCTSQNKWRRLLGSWWIEWPRELRSWSKALACGSSYLWNSIVDKFLPQSACLINSHVTQSKPGISYRQACLLTVAWLDRPQVGATPKTYRRACLVSVAWLDRPKVGVTPKTYRQACLVSIAWLDRPV